MFNLISKNKHNKLIKEYIATLAERQAEIENLNNIIDKGRIKINSLSGVVQNLTLLERNYNDLEKIYNELKIEKENLEKEFQKLKEIPNYELVSLSADQSIHKDEVGKIEGVDVIQQVKEEAEIKLIEELKKSFKYSETKDFNMINIEVSFEYFQLED